MDDWVLVLVDEHVQVWTRGRVTALETTVDCAPMYWGRELVVRGPEMHTIRFAVYPDPPPPPDPMEGIVEWVDEVQRSDEGDD